MKTFFIAIFGVAFSVTAQFLLKAGVSGEGVAKLAAQSYPIETLSHLFTDKYILEGLTLYIFGAVALHSTRPSKLCPFCFFDDLSAGCRTSATPMRHGALP